MRPETQKRLIALLVADITKLKTKVDTNPLDEWISACRELDQLGNDFYSIKDLIKNNKEASEIAAKVKVVQATRDKAWRAHKSQQKNLEKWLKEQYALERDLRSLKYSFAYHID